MSKINPQVKDKNDKLVLNILKLVNDDIQIKKSIEEKKRKAEEEKKRKDYYNIKKQIEEEKKIKQKEQKEKELEEEKIKKEEEQKLKIQEKKRKNQETFVDKYKRILGNNNQFDSFIKSLESERVEVNSKINAINEELKKTQPIDNNRKIELESQLKDLNILLEKINNFLEDKQSIFSKVPLPNLQNIKSLFSWFTNSTQEPPKPSTYIDLFLGNSILNPELNDLIVQDIKIVKQNNNPLYEAIQGVDTLLAMNKLQAINKKPKKETTYSERIKIEHNRQLSEREKEIKKLNDNKNNV